MPPDELARAASLFSALPINEKASFLALTAHTQTIFARALYRRNPQDAEGLWRSNEMVHRICGFIAPVLEGMTEPVQEASVIAMIFTQSDVPAGQMWRWLGEDRSSGAATPPLRVD